MIVLKLNATVLASLGMKSISVSSVLVCKVTLQYQNLIFLTCKPSNRRLENPEHFRDFHSVSQTNLNKFG